MAVCFLAGRSRLAAHIPSTDRIVSTKRSGSAFCRTRSLRRLRLRSSPAPL